MNGSKFGSSIIESCQSCQLKIGHSNISAIFKLAQKSPQAPLVFDEVYKGGKGRSGIAHLSVSYMQVWKHLKTKYQIHIKLKQFINHEFFYMIKEQYTLF